VTRPTAPEPTSDVVRVLRPADEAAAARLLARGFAEEPGNVALIPDPELRRRFLELGAAISLRGTVPRGTAHAAVVGDDLAAIALWHPPGATGVSLRRTADALGPLLAATPTLARALPGMGRGLIRAGTEGPALLRARGKAVAVASRGLAWHLAFLATAPEHRGRGLARRLLERQLLRCDQDGSAAWLETTDPVNPPIYERFGFATVAHVERAAWLPGLWVMRRKPTGRA
jgi:GNAT superfamily N-acetyltransferase